MQQRKSITNIIFIGSGAIATSLGNILAANQGHEVQLLSVEQDVVESVNKEHVNFKYFPNYQLHPLLKATHEKTVLKQADVVFLAIPSTAIVTYLHQNLAFIRPDALLVNLAKGFGNESDIIPDCLAAFLKNPIVSMKGPSFAREIINRQPTAFTIACADPNAFEVFDGLFDDTTIHLDFTQDVKGVEYASILKNIYAIIIGIVDANFDSPNLRSLVLSKAINEMRSLITAFGGNDQTIFNYCGFGDFSLTALNDLSRNRTLGLLIGKGFFSKDISEKVVLEGRIAVNIFFDQLQTRGIDADRFPLMRELYRVFNESYDIGKFVSRILND